MHTLTTAIAEHKITVESVFVPFSQSRNKDQKHRSLNWKVTLKRDGRDVLATEYSAGIAHCPGYNRKPPANWDRPVRFWQQAISDWETENGFEAVLKPFMRDFARKQGPRPDSDIEAGRPRVFFPILPKTEDVVASLLMDSSVLDYATYEEWGPELGYDADSRAGLALYHDCLKTALRLRSGLGETTMAALREAAQDW